MAFWFLRGLRRGVVTTGYPARPDPSAALLPTPPAFHADRLTPPLADALCRICPAGALSRHAAVLRFDAGACTACGLCVTYAPEAATPSGEFELAATARDHLVKHLPIRDGVAPEDQTDSADRTGHVDRENPR
jgi:formate hydrogenlyase subunit 6/NADH:ubiquinone oxidoreductase subunit I